jgi:2,3-bisphosphoglycerate-dependent phosphoglycerate mutase
MHLEGLSAEAMERVEIPSGVPLVYRFDAAGHVLGREWLELPAAAPAA